MDNDAPQTMSYTDLPEYQTAEQTSLDQLELLAGTKGGGTKPVPPVIDGLVQLTDDEYADRLGLLQTDRDPVLNDMWALGLHLQPHSEDSRFYTGDDIRVKQQVRNHPNLDTARKWLITNRGIEFHVGVMFPYKNMGDGNLVHGGTKAKLDRQQQFLGGIASGLNRTQAAKAVDSIGGSTSSGIHPATYRGWINNEPDFKAAFDDAVRKAAIDRQMGRLVGDGKHYVPEFEEFRQHYFGYDSPPHHLQVIEAIESATADEWTLILMPPDAGKTTLLKDFICYNWAENPNLRVMYVGEKDDGNSTPAKVMMDIKERLTDHTYTDAHAPYPTRIPEYIERFGPFRDTKRDKNRPWKQSAIKIGTAGGGNWYSLETASVYSRILGTRTDWIIFDDIQSETTLNFTTKILNEIRGKFASRYSREEGKVVFLGNGVGAGSIYEKLIEEGMIKRVIIIPAIGEDGESFWPERWPIESLAARKRLVGEDRWLANYQQQPRSPGTQVFADDIVELSHNRDRGIVGASREWAKANTGQGLQIVAGIDPAISGECAIHVAAFTNDRMTIIDQDIVGNLGNNEAIFERIRYMSRHHFTRLIFEYNAQQKGLGRDQRLEAMASKLGFTIEPHETGANKRDLRFGVAAMASSFLKREIDVPYGDEQTRERMKPLLDQLSAWRGNVPTRLLKQDAVMSMWFTWLWWEKNREYIADNDEDWTFDIPGQDSMFGDTAAQEAFMFG